jgi:uncharacterized protein (TIGR03435 family)
VKLTFRIRRLHYGAALLALFATSQPAFAQSAAMPDDKSPAEFEAVSVHMVDSHSAEESSFTTTFPTNLFAMRNAPLIFLIQFAYNVDSQEHISATPGWMDSQGYDVSAKVEGDQRFTLEQLRPMLRRLLEQRFHFAAHHETKMVSGFTLIVLKGGSKLQHSGGEGKPFAQLLSNRMDVRNLDTQHIAGVLAHRAGQPVVDKTGLTGNYDFRLSYAPANDANSGLPDFFTAVQEQLGLKLESQKIPVDFLVIDRIERVPTEN